MRGTQARLYSTANRRDSDERQLAIGSDGGATRLGVAPNDLTDSADRDFLAGTPWHKHVPARLERLPA